MGKEEVIVLYEDEEYYDIIGPQQSPFQNLSQHEIAQTSDSPEIPHHTETLVKKTSDFPNTGRGKYFSIHVFEDMIPEPVLPKYIDGLSLYKIEMTHNMWMRKISDLLYFTMMTSSKSGYHGYGKIGKYEGLWMCNNLQCSFKSTSFNNQPNLNTCMLEENRYTRNTTETDV